MIGSAEQITAPPMPKVKPPLGLEPRKVHDYQRVKDIVAAMNRYIEVDKVIPTEWAEELWDILLYHEP